jgi:hypothetical protein
MRSGTEYQGQVALVKQDKTVFKVDDNQMELSNSDIYMIKYKKRGNVFFTETGERFTSEGDGKIPSCASAIYLIEGKEVAAYDITIDTNNVSYYPLKSKKIGLIQVNKKGSSSFSIPKNEVFLIHPCNFHDMIWKKMLSTVGKYLILELEMTKNYIEKH